MITSFLLLLCPVYLIKWSNHVSTCAYALSDQSLCLSREYYISVKLLTEHHLEFLNLKGGCIGSSESTRVRMPHCWKSRHNSYVYYLIVYQLAFIWYFFMDVASIRFCSNNSRLNYGIVWRRPKTKNTYVP